MGIDNAIDNYNRDADDSSDDLPMEEITGQKFGLKKQVFLNWGTVFLRVFEVTDHENNISFSIWGIFTGI